MKKIPVLIVLLAVLHIHAKGQFQLSKDKSSAVFYKGTINQPDNRFAVNINQFLNDSAGISKDHAYYLQKSKNQRKAGLILLGSGVLLSGIGLLIATSNNANFDNTQTGVTIMGIGALSGIVSIPMMIMAHANRSKAKLLLSEQKTGYGVPSKKGYLTGVTISIPMVTGKRQ